VVLPEGTPESEGSRPKTLIGIGAALVLLLTTVALAVATAPDDVIANESTTTTIVDEPLYQPTTTTTIDVETFSVSDIATGERLSWREAPRLDAQWPIELLEHDGRLYLFTSDGQSHPRHLSSGLQVWVSSDGIGWERIAELEEAAITSIAATGGRLVAMGKHIEHGSPHVWISTDGVEWSASQLPMRPGTDLPITTWLTDAAVAGDRIIVTGSGYTNPQEVILDLLPTEVANYVDTYGMGLSEGPEGRSIEVYGPLGIVGYEATMEDLGIDEETANDLFQGSGQELSYVWTSSDGVEWTVSETSGPRFERLWIAAGGELLASGWDNTGPAVWSSTDDYTWERTDSQMVNVVDSWNGWLVGTRNERDVIRSRDGREWESLGTDAVLPQALDWYMQTVDVGPGGIAAVATTWAQQPNSTVDATAVEVADHTLTVDYDTGILTIEGLSGRSDVQLWSEDSVEHVVVDFADEQMTFMDVETGEELLTVGFERLREVEMSLFGWGGFEKRALLLSRGQELSIFDLAEEIGDQEDLVMIRVLEDRMILVTNPIHAWYAASPPAWSIRVATLP
jgi:hypothetical protein